MTAPDFETDIRALSGKPVWSVVCGRGTGSHLSIGLGDRVRRPRALQNEKLSADERMFAAEYEFLIYCAWRFDSATSVVGGWQDAQTETMEFIASQLRGSSISTAALRWPAGDLDLEFSCGLRLRVFCDHTDRDELDNYLLSGPSGIWSLGLRGVVGFEVAVR